MFDSGNKLNLGLKRFTGLGGIEVLDAAAEEALFGEVLDEDDLGGDEDGRLAGLTRDGDFDEGLFIILFAAFEANAAFGDVLALDDVIAALRMSSGMRPLLRTTCGGKREASGGRMAEQFGTYEDLDVFQIGMDGRAKKKQSGGERPGVNVGGAACCAPTRENRSATAARARRRPGRYCRWRHR